MKNQDEEDEEDLPEAQAALSCGCTTWLF